jgi:hypothetical protein
VLTQRAISCAALRAPPSSSKTTPTSSEAPAAVT